MVQAAPPSNGQLTPPATRFQSKRYSLQAVPPPLHLFSGLCCGARRVLGSEHQGSVTTTSSHVVRPWYVTTRSRRDSIRPPSGVVRSSWSTARRLSRSRSC